MIKNSLKLILITLFLISPGFAQKVYLRGRVVDKDYKAIQGAQVKLFKANKTQHTDWEVSLISKSILLLYRIGGSPI